MSSFLKGGKVKRPTQNFYVIFGHLLNFLRSWLENSSQTEWIWNKDLNVIMINWKVSGLYLYRFPLQGFGKKLFYWNFFLIHWYKRDIFRHINLTYRQLLCVKDPGKLGLMQWKVRKGVVLTSDQIKIYFQKPCLTSV